jgi:hydroxypyruvate isomerase
MEDMVNRREFGGMAAMAGIGALMAARGLGQVADGSVTAPAPWKFSVMLWVLAKVAPFDRALEMVAEAGYQGVELTGQSNSWSEAEMERVMGKMKSLGLRFDMMSGVKSGFCDPHGGEGLLAELKTQFGMMKRMGCSQVNLKSGLRIEGLEAGAQKAASIENLRRAAELAGAHGMQIVIEPIDALESKEMWMTSVSQGFEIARAVDSPHLKVLYDFYHEQRGAGNLLEKLEKNIDLVALVHVADVPGRHEPGTGEVNYPNIYKKLAELKYDKWMTMEFYPSGPDVVGTLRRARLEAVKAGNRD